MPETITPTPLYLDPLFIVPVVLVLLVIGVVALYWVARRWQAEVIELNQRIGQRLTSLRKPSPTVQQALEEFDPGDPEPYGPLATKLHALVNHTSVEANAIQQTRTALLRRLPTKSWPHRIFGPLLWWQLRRKYTQLSTQLEALIEEQHQAEELLSDLQGIGWDEAELARALEARLHETRKQLHALAERGAYGKALESAQLSFKQLNDELHTLPEVFFSGTKTQVLADTLKADIIKAHRQLTRLDPRTADLLERARTWQAQHGQATAAIAALLEKFTAAEAQFNDLPQTIDAREQHLRLQNLRQVVASLREVQREMDVESFASVIDGAERVQRAAEEIYEELGQARSDIETLNRLTPRVNSSLLYLATQLTSLETVPAYPIKWTTTADTLAALQTQLRQLPAPGKPRTPAQLRADSETLIAIQDRQNTLSSHYAEIETQRLALVELWESDELTTADQWLRQIEQTLPFINTYHGSNWPKEVGHKTLWDDARKIAEATQRLVPTRANYATPEDNLAERLQATEALVAERRTFDERFAVLELRLKSIQELEKQSVEWVAEALTALDDITSLGAASPLLAEITRKQMQKLRDQGHKHQSALSQKDKGKIEKVTTEAEHWAAAVQRQANDWLIALEQAIESERQKVADTLNKLDEITTFSDPVIGDAQTLLAPDPHRRRDAALELKDIVSELGSRSQTAAQWYSVRTTLEEDVAEPVIAAYTHLLQKINEANKAIDTAAKTIPATRRWPPTSANLEPVLREQRAADNDLRAVRSQRSRAAQVAARLERLAEQFELVAAQGLAVAKQTVDEKNAVSTLENRLRGIKLRWQKRLRDYVGDPTAYENIESLLRDADREYSAIQQRYLDRAYEFAEAYAALQDVCDQFESEPVPLGNGEVITIDGDRLRG